MSTNNRPPMVSHTVKEAHQPGVNYARKPEYLHQSMLRLLEESPVDFFLQELAPEGTVPDTQSMPAAVGCAFDAYIKSMIARVTGVPCPPLKKMIAENVVLPTPEAILEALDRGRKLLVGYVESGALTALLSERPHSLDLHIKTKLGKVPIAGTLDASMLNIKEKKKMWKVDSQETVRWLGTLHKPKHPQVVHDWKTTGHNRPGQVSPHPGYLRLFDTEGPGICVGPHDRHREPLEAIDERWATQVTVYGFLLGHAPGRHEVSIDEVIVGKDDRVRVAQFRTHVTKKFQQKVRERLHAAWKKIQDEDVIPATWIKQGLPFLKAMR